MSHDVSPSSSPRRRGFASLAFLSAGALLFTSTSALLLAAKEGVQKGLSRSRRLSQGEMDSILGAVAAKARVGRRAMRGVPTMRTLPAAPPSSLKAKSDVPTVDVSLGLAGLWGLAVRATAAHAPGDGIGATMPTDDGVGLATGEEQYEATDLKVYNPTGPAVDWTRSYHSLSPNAGINDFGVGWSQPYDLKVLPTGPGAAELVFPDDARVPFTYSAAPTSGTPVVSCTVPSGYRMEVRAVWVSSTHSEFVVTFPDRTRWSFDYGTSGVLPIARLSDRAGNWIGFTYASGRLASIDDSSATPLLTLGRNTGGFIVSASDRYGRSVYYAPATGGAGAGLLAQASQIVATGTSSPPVRYGYGYTGIGGNPYLDAIAVPSPTGTGTSTSTVTYDASSHVDHTTDANGNVREYRGEDWNGTPSSSLTTVKVKDPSSALVEQYTEGFDTALNATVRKNALGQTVYAKAYASSAAPYSPTSFADGNGRVWSFAYDAQGNLASKTTNKGTVTAYGWDYTNFALGELASVQEGTKTPTTFSYYQPSGLVASVDAPVPGNVGASATQSTTYTYTAMGQVQTVTTPGNNAASTLTTFYNYGSTERLGEPLAVVDPRGKPSFLGYDARGNLGYRQDENGNGTNWNHDLADATTATFLPYTGAVGPYQTTVCANYPLYPGGPVDLTFVADESGSVARTTYFAYGAEGETLARTGSAEEVHLTYDAAYRTQTLTDGHGGTTTYAYDASGRTTEIDHPGATGTGYDKVRYTSYDPEGNVLSRTDGNGQVTNYTYGDADGRLTAVSYPGATANNVTLGYDAYDRATATTDAVGSSSTAYDDADDVISAARTYTGLSAQISTYSYWPDGSRHTMANVAGTWSYGYDADGRYVSMTSPVGTSSAAYLDNGWQSSRTLPNGVVTAYAYNPVGALNGQTSASGSTTASSYSSFSFDGVFNVTGMTTSVTGVSSHSGTVGYAYDAKDRLTGESSTRLGGYSQSHAYDGAGNPTTLRGTSASFNADNQRTGTGYAHDGNGNPTTYGGTALGFDPENGLVSLGSSWGAGYGADGLRGWKDVSGVRTYYLYDGGDPVVELDASGSVTAVNVHAPDGLVARIVGSTTVQYAFDPQGSVAQRLDASGSVLSSSVYDAYGAESSTSTPSDPFGYDARWGYYEDRETGLAYCQNRYYDPASGRWLNRDPIGMNGGINVYGYCESGPVNRLDPEGLHWVYYISTGELYYYSDYDDSSVLVGTGYSGAPGHVNKPDDVALHDQGPLPPGQYTIGGDNHHMGPVSLPLKPAKGNHMHHRNGFYIHGDNPSHPGASSTGCIVLPKTIRQQVADSGDDQLIVYK